MTIWHILEIHWSQRHKEAVKSHEKTASNRNLAAACGERVKGKLFVGEFSTGTEVYLPVVILNGAQDGPVIWVNACVHGNELNGTLAAQKLARELDPRDIRGAVVITPISNPLAYREKKRLSFLEGNYGMGENCNMGEVFPGRMDGCMTEKLAFVLLEEIKKTVTVPEKLDFRMK